MTTTKEKPTQTPAPLPYPEASSPAFEQRIIKSADQEHVFNFKSLMSPEDWPPASAFSSSYLMPVLGTNKVNRFKLSGISYSQWEDLETKHRMPDEMPRTTKTEKIEYDSAHDAVTNARKIYLFELSTGKKIPGETQEEKISWLRKLGVGETDALYSQVIDTFASQGDLLARYLQLSSENIEIVDCDMDLWASSSEVGYIFRMQRKFEDFIVEIPLKQITEETKKEIEEATRDDLPPSKAGKNPATGRIDMNVIEYNWDDPKWKAGKKVKARKRLLMQLDALLPFKIPGVSYEERYKWIGERLLYDVITLRNFIDNQLFEYGSRINFFTNLSGLQT